MADVGEEAHARAVAVAQRLVRLPPAPACAREPRPPGWRGQRARRLLLLLDARRHLVEAAGEQAELVVAERPDAEGEVAAADRDRAGARVARSAARWSDRGSSRRARLRRGRTSAVRPMPQPSMRTSAPPRCRPPRLRRSRPRSRRRSGPRTPRRAAVDIAEEDARRRLALAGLTHRDAAPRIGGSCRRRARADARQRARTRASAPGRGRVAARKSVSSCVSASERFETRGDPALQVRRSPAARARRSSGARRSTSNIGRRRARGW